jgi:hypothetical protein
MSNRKMVNPQRISDQCGAHIIKRITCGWDGAEYKTTLYKKLNGGVARLCDCAGYTHKRKCYHLPALEQWARDSVQKSKENKNEKGQ